MLEVSENLSPRVGTERGLLEINIEFKKLLANRCGAMLIAKYAINSIAIQMIFYFSGSLFIQARGMLKKELIGHLRSKRRIRRSQHSGVGGQSRGQIIDAVSMRQRPAEIEDRAIPGHREGDLIGGTKNTHIATLAERHSRFTALVKVPSKDTAAVYQITFRAN